MFSNTQLKTAGSAFALVLVVVGLLVGAAGGAAAQETATATATPTTTGVVANDTVSVDNDTRSVYADLEAGPNSSVELNVTFTPIGPDGNESEPSTQTVSLNASNEQLVEHTEINANETSEFRVLVETTDGNSTEATAEVGTIQKVAGGSSGAIGDAVEQAGGIGVVVVAGVVVLLLLRGRGDD